MAVFKTLASVVVWILFVFGCLSLLGGFGRIIMGSDRSLELVSSYFGYGIVSLILSVVAAKLRQTMD